MSNQPAAKSANQIKNQVYYHPMTRRVGKLILVMIMAMLAWILVSAFQAKEQITPKISSEKFHDYEYMYSFAILRNTPEDAARLTVKVLTRCQEIGLPAEEVTRLVWKESHWLMRSKGSRKEDGQWILSDYGLFQICAEAVKNDLWRYRDRYPLIQTNTMAQILEAIQNEDINIYIGTSYLKKCLDWNWGNYRLMYTMYNHGPYSEARANLLHHGIGNDYETALMDPAKIEKEVKIFQHWKIVKVDPPLQLISL